MSRKAPTTMEARHEDPAELAAVDGILALWEQNQEKLNDDEWFIYAVSKITREMQKGAAYDVALSRVQMSTPERMTDLQTNPAAQLMIMNKLFPRSSPQDDE